MVRQVEKVMDVRNPRVIPKVSNEAPEALPKNLALNLFDLDPCVEPERPARIDLGLDQLEDEE